ncbi:MAG: hypothetical protein JXA67_11190 [Micromonosporaceae bacterium]|nr:hypothetical protein [Micromonosporaceae bacterium]
MSPRRHHRKKDDSPALDVDRARHGVQIVQSLADGQWFVRSVPGDAAMKLYRCPGCDHEIRPGVAHIVSWPADGRGDAGDRRHWHTGCWKGRSRRGFS